MALSTRMKQALFSQETEEVMLALLKIEQDDLDVPIYVVDNFEDINSNGITYIGFPFRLILMGDEEDAAPSATLEIDNVDRQIVNAVRNMTTAADITFSIILAATPDTVEIGPIAMKLKNVSWNENTVTGTLVTDDILDLPFPGEEMTPGKFPGLF